MIHPLIVFAVTTIAMFYMIIRILIDMFAAIEERKWSSTVYNLTALFGAIICAFQLWSYYP